MEVVVVCGLTQWTGATSIVVASLRNHAGHTSRGICHIHRSGKAPEPRLAFRVHLVEEALAGVTGENEVAVSERAPQQDASGLSAALRPRRVELGQACVF